MEDLEKLARSWFDALATRDFDTLAGMYVADAEWLRPDGNSKGVDAIVTWLKTIAESFPDETATIQAVLVSPGAVTVEWTDTGTHTVAYKSVNFGVVQPTGKSYRLPVVEIFRFRDGKIVSQHEYCDLLSMLRQVGWLGLLAQAAART